MLKLLQRLKKLDAKKLAKLAALEKTEHAQYLDAEIASFIEALEAEFALLAPPRPDLGKLGDIVDELMPEDSDLYEGAADKLSNIYSVLNHYHKKNDDGSPLSETRTGQQLSELQTFIMGTQEKIKEKSTNKPLTKADKRRLEKQRAEFILANKLEEIDVKLEGYQRQVVEQELIALIEQQPTAKREQYLSKAEDRFDLTLLIADKDEAFIPDNLKEKLEKLENLDKREGDSNEVLTLTVEIIELVEQLPEENRKQYYNCSLNRFNLTRLIADKEKEFIPVDLKDKLTELEFFDPGNDSSDINRLIAEITPLVEQLSEEQRNQYYRYTLDMKKLVADKNDFLSSDDIQLYIKKYEKAQELRDILKVEGSNNRVKLMNFEAKKNSKEVQQTFTANNDSAGVRLLKWLGVALTLGWAYQRLIGTPNVDEQMLQSVDSVTQQARQYFR